MLAIASSDALTLTDISDLKRASGSIPSGLALDDHLISCSWAADNESIFFTSATGLKRYYPAQSLLESVQCSLTAGSSLIVCDDHTLICSAEHRVHLLNIEAARNLVTVRRTFESHKSHVNFLSLNNDSSLLASTSSQAVHVHNLETGSLTVLRGVPLGSQSIGACVFQLHMRSCLLLGVGTQLVVYDTLKPSAPRKVVQLPDISGCITAIACSPFSKTLVAVSTTKGHVGLIDLDKQKGLFRILELQHSITCIAFSPEGAAICVGLNDGKLLFIDLRSLDKPPKSIIVDETGHPIIAIATQVSAIVTSHCPLKMKCLKADVDCPAASNSSTQRRSTTPSIVSARRQISSSVSVRKAPLNEKNQTPLTRTADKENKFSANAKTSKAIAKKSDVSKSNQLETCNAKILGSMLKKQSLGPNLDQDRRTSRKVPSVGSQVEPAPSTAYVRRAPASETSGQGKTRTISDPSRAGSVSTRLVADRSSETSISHNYATRSRSSSASSPTSSSSRREDEIATVASTPPQPQIRRVNPRRSSNDLSGLRTVIFETKPSGQEVGKEDEESGEENRRTTWLRGDLKSGEDLSDDVIENNRRIIVSPRRPATIPAGALAASPFSQPGSGSPTAASPVHELLRTIVKDVMYDFDQERRSEMMGLHLDLVRMGRGWKKDLRDGMQELIEDMKDLREENRRLRDENERLRRGY